MKHANDQCVTMQYVGFGYTLEKAVKLMHREVMQKNKFNQKRSLQNTGLVSGILHINEEIELVVQFYDHIEQFTESEFESKLCVLEDSHG